MDGFAVESSGAGKATAGDGDASLLFAILVDRARSDTVYSNLNTHFV
jgi:hypothetical protein